MIYLERSRRREPYENAIEKREKKTAARMTKILCRSKMKFAEPSAKAIRRKMTAKVIWSM